MRQDEFNTLLEEIQREERAVREDGQREYAHDESNAFRNFEQAGIELGIPREQVLWILLKKHLDGILAWIRGHRSQREDVRGRIKDARMYLALLWGMAAEVTHFVRVRGSEPAWEAAGQGIPASHDSRLHLLPTQHHKITLAGSEATHHYWFRVPTEGVSVLAVFEGDELNHPATGMTSLPIERISLRDTCSASDPSPGHCTVALNGREGVIYLANAPSFPITVLVRVSGPAERADTPPAAPEPLPLGAIVIDIRQAGGTASECGANTSIWQLDMPLAWLENEHGESDSIPLYILSDETSNFIGPVVNGDSQHWVYAWTTIESARLALNRYVVGCL